MTDTLKPPCLRKLDRRGDIQVWVVDGRYVRERNRMIEGIPYSEAHAESSHLEFQCRHHPDELHDALSVEGWA